MNKVQGLLNWCKFQTEGYPNVSITNFTSSWKNGLAFNALIHKFKPDLINYHELESDNIFYNNYIAFEAAEMHLGIPALLDPKDMCLSESLDRLSIITYVSQFYNCLKAMQPEGGYNINKFEHLKNDNFEFDSISARASVNRLTRLKCTICHQKVFLLERYVADDKLYHRKCYRIIQINSINNESEVIGDYLNIYGELKPTMKKGIFIHPIQGLIETVSDAVEIETSDPVNIVEESGSEFIESENASDSESLSTYDYSENELENEINSDEEHFVEDTKAQLFPNEGERVNKNDGDESVKEDSDIDDIYRQNQSKLEKISTVEKNPIEERISVEMTEEIVDTEMIKKIIDREKKRPSCQENLVISIVNDTPATPMKQRLYVKKRDKALPYSTFFEVPDNDWIHLESDDCQHDVDTQLRTTLSPSSIIHRTPLKLNYPVNELVENNNVSLPATPAKAVTWTTSEIPEKKKLIMIVPDEEYDSDVSSIVEESKESVKPLIIRDSIWRQPIISAVTSHKHRSACVPIEGKFRDYAEFKDRLEELNTKQSEIEIKARKIQQKLWDENSNSPQYEHLLAIWLNLVEEKDKIFYEENALYSWIKDLKLQEMRVRLEAQIRLLSSTNDPTTSEKEKELVAKLIETVNQRSELVDAMHQENVRRLDILKLRHEVIENVTSHKDANDNQQVVKRGSPIKKVKNFWKRKSSNP